jgi:hypothetical protein
MRQTSEAVFSMNHFARKLWPFVYTKVEVVREHAQLMVTVSQKRYHQKRQ